MMIFHLSSARPALADDAPQPGRTMLNAGLVLSVLATIGTAVAIASFTLGATSRGDDQGFTLIPGMVAAPLVLVEMAIAIPLMVIGHRKLAQPWRW